MTQVVLRTRRLLLRPPRVQDADFMVEALGNRAVWEWLSVIPQPYTRSHALDFIEGRVGRGANWLIELEGVPTGVIGLDNELGYWLAEPFWGQGIITEAADAVIDHAFADPARAEILSGHFDANARSRRALEKLGFVDAGAKALGCISDGRTEIPSRHMILTRARWQERRRLRIQTPRLELRELGQADAPALRAALGRPEVARNLLSVRAPWGDDDLRDFIEASRYRGRPGFRLGIWREGALIGTIGMGGTPTPRIMYALAPEHWGQGLASEALGAFLPEIDARFAPARLLADHFEDNPASGAVLRKHGFAETGREMGISPGREGAHRLICYERGHG